MQMILTLDSADYMAPEDLPAFPRLTSATENMGSAKKLEKQRNIEDYKIRPGATGEAGTPTPTRHSEDEEDGHPSN